LSKSFVGNLVLDDVSLDIRKGEIHAICGENGAGKSTLVNIVSGVHKRDAGTIIFDGEETNFANARESVFKGIGFVHQELALCQDLTVAENMWMWSMPNKNGVINHKELYRKTEEILKNFDADFNATDIVETLSVAQQQIAEIAKAMSLNAKLIILDEPTSSITEIEVEKLFRMVKNLRDQGIGIIYITHRMNEVFALCDRVTVLRDGVLVKTLDTAKTTHDEVVSSMVGREISDFYPPKTDMPKEDQTELMRAEDFRGTGFDSISFTLRKGRVLGFCGLIGSGRTELMRALCGLGGYQSGKLFYNDAEIHNKKYPDAIKNKICYLTEDRKRNGLFLGMSVKSNLVAAVLEDISRMGLLNEKEATRLSDLEIEQMNIKTQSREAILGSLSGGNQQKVMIGKWMTVQPEIMIMDEPTRGIDVGAKSEIHFMLRRLCNEGVGVIVVSSEMPEIIGVCDDVVVMHEGKYMGMVSDDDITENNLIKLAHGGDLENNNIGGEYSE
jgi:ribose transport system ATP-binding protein